MSQPAPLSKPSSTRLETGEVLDGKYRLECELGRGSMGTVWRALHLTLGQRVAIKLIAPEHAQSEEIRGRFGTEARAAARLKSRHVVQVHDTGETPEGIPFIVMEHLDGESLESRIERGGALPSSDAVRVTSQVLRGLARAHAQGIVHRDLKPANIFLARSDEDELGWVAKVLDFGIAKLVEHPGPGPLSTEPGTVLGTPLFMSPEQAKGSSAVDHRTDLYSLGMCFYNMVTGQCGFQSETFGEIVVAICTEPLPELGGKVPEPLALWFERACARDPKQRFQSADEMNEALKLASARASGTSSSPLLATLGRSVKKPKWLPFMLICSALAGAFVLFLRFTSEPLAELQASPPAAPELARASSIVPPPPAPAAAPAIVEPAAVVPPPPQRASSAVPPQSAKPVTRLAPAHKPSTPKPAKAKPPIDVGF